MDKILDNLFENYKELEYLRTAIFEACDVLMQSYDNNGKLLVCGNGGSASDCEHIVGELLKGFKLKRSIDKRYAKRFSENSKYFMDNLQGALPAISLVGHSSLFTAWCNDVQPDLVFAQQVFGLGNYGDVLLAISTSGNAKNVVNAVITAKAKGLKTIGLTGQAGGRLNELCDVTIKVPSQDTYRIQEYHLPIYHAICEILEFKYFN